MWANRNKLKNLTTVSMILCELFAMFGKPGSTSVERNTKKDFTPKQNEKIRFYRVEIMDY